METQLFDIAGGWDQVDTMSFGFLDVTSKVVLGEYPVGTKFGSAWFDYGLGTLTLYDADGQTELGCFNLTLQVTPAVAKGA